MSHWSDNYNVGGSLCNDNDFNDGQIDDDDDF